jgi:hypothetical protein
MITTAAVREQNKEQTAFYSRVFQSKMQNICEFLEALLAEIYSKIYKSNATFRLTPMARLEVTKMEDLKVLHEVGVLQPDHTVELASILLGRLKRAKQMNPMMGMSTDSEKKSDPEKESDPAKKQ